MRIFVSYASEDRGPAEAIALALRSDAHEVFFDQSQLVGGENYHRVIREQIAAADLLVFLVSPHSVQTGGYALSELRAARERWPSPAGHVVPVLLRNTPMDDIPGYLRAVTLFQPRGNAAAEVAMHVHRLSRAGRRRRWAALAAALLVLAAGIGAYIHYGIPSQARSGFVSSIADSDFVTDYVMPPDALERREYTLDPTTRFPADADDVVRLERLAFGRLTDGRNAFSVRVSVNNTTAQPIQLDLTTRFFELGDDRGQQADLLFFCCDARGDVIAPGEQRVVQLIYASRPGWQGKETTPGMIRFVVSGLLPVVRATWVFRPLAAAA